MDIVNRAKNIILSPKKEWEIIATENDNHVKVLTTYLLILALIPTVATFINWGVIGGTFLKANFGWGLRYAIQQFVSIIGGAYLTAWIFDMLAPNFGAEKNFDRSFSLTAYCYTAFCIAGVFNIYWSLSILASLGGLYSLFLLYWGLKPMKNVPDDKVTSYFIIALICMVAVAMVLATVMGVVIGVRSVF